MNFFKRLLLPCGIILLLSGCASIVSKTNWPFSVDTQPSGASVTITNKKGVEVFSGKTPTAMKLRSGSGFFGKESYTVSITKEGYEPKKVTIECRVNGWYFGNILIGGLIGMLIVDPATGAMYRLDSDGISETLQKSTAISLQILDKSQIPQTWEDRLVQLN